MVDTLGEAAPAGRPLHLLRLQEEVLGNFHDPVHLQKHDGF